MKTRKNTRAAGRSGSTLPTSRSAAIEWLKSLEVIGCTALIK